MPQLTLLNVLLDHLFNYSGGYLKDGFNQLSHLSVFLFLGNLHEEKEVFVPMHSNYFTFRLLCGKFCPDPFLNSLNIHREFSCFLRPDGSHEGDSVCQKEG